MSSIDFTIEFLSDWHIGTGSGRHGHLDRVYQRDHDGHPFVGAKALAGLLRENIRLIADGLDNGSDGPWHEMATWLLGDEPAASSGRNVAAPRPAAVHIDAATLPPAVKAQLQQAPRLLAQLAIERPGVRLDEYGTAVTDHLRFTEMAPAGLVLHGRAHLPKDAPDTAIALVVAGLSSIRRIGGGRRRGQGRCRVEVGNGKSLLESLRDPAPVVPTASVQHSAASAVVTASGTLRQVDLHIRTLSPVVVRSDVRGNAIRTHTTLPGNVLLAMVAANAPVAARHAIATSSLRVGTGHPSVGSTATLPAPLSLHLAKASQANSGRRVAYNLVADTNTEQQLKQLRNAHLARTATGWVTVDVPTTNHTHNTIDDQLQRPTSDVGGLFSTEAIAAGTTFCASLLMTDEAMAAMLTEAGASSISELLSGERRIGTSRKDDYGRVMVTALDPVQPQSATGTAATAVVLLTADLIATDDRGRSLPNEHGVAHELSRALSTDMVVEGHSFVRSTRRESWHGVWSLPRPTLVGVQAGSVVRVRRADGAPLDLAALSQLGANGIGGRVAEGFGRFVVNHELFDAARVELGSAVAEADRVDQSAATSDADRALLQRLASQAWRTMISERVSLAVARGQHHSELHVGERRTTASQLGALRTAARESGGDVRPVLRWWNHMKATPDRRKKWPKQALDAITELLEQPDGVWRILDVTHGDAATIDPATTAESLRRWAPVAVTELLAASARASQHDKQREGDAE